MCDSQKQTEGSRYSLLALSNFEDSASPYNFIFGFSCSEAAHISALLAPLLALIRFLPQNHFCPPNVSFIKLHS